jgi:hypothetical protein
MLRWLALALALLAAPAWSADDLQQQIGRVQSTLNSLTQEQSAVFQQFQMVQELRRAEERSAFVLPGTTSYGSSPPSFDDQQRIADARQQRLYDLQGEGDRLYARYRELEDQKRGLLDTLSALALQSGVPPPLPSDTAVIVVPASRPLPTALPVPGNTTSLPP